VGTTLVLLGMFHLAQRVFSPKHTLTIDMRGKNVACQILQVGHVLAVLLLVPGVVKNALVERSLATSALWAAAFAAAGLLLIQVVGTISIRTLLRATLQRELERGNVAAGVAAGSSYVAVGILASRAIAGSDLRGLGLSVTFFGISVATLGAFVALFRALTTYDDAEQIQGENLAAAISYAGITIAIALLVGRAVEGDFEGWRTSLIGYGTVVAGGLALYPVRQIIVQGLILGRIPTLRGGSLDDAIGLDRNRGMAIMEALTYIATAVAVAELA
jgi:uncharacterized membrane protein YjfL (UPF0719 family)